ncbi:unnamed protein product [Mytilus coruscus]|uniref:Gustatory receptor n=1 Tax=Mytilus coruscus TaxID=42192 RepID=A0A6J8CRZ3_MYTCO|nr:unnamed protein product [Mytilus coruscus]
MINIIKIKTLDEHIQTASSVVDGINKDIEEEKASDLYKPLIRFLEVCGSYSKRQKKGRKCVFTIHFAYCIVVQVLVFVMSARYLTVFRNGSSQLYKTIGLIAYFYYYANLTVFSFIYFYSNCKYLPTFLSTINKYNVDFGVSFKISHKRKTIRRILLIVCAILVSYTILVIWSVLYLELKGLLVTSNLAPFDESNGITFYIATITFGVFGMLFNGITISNTTILLLNASLLKQEFKNVTRRIRDIIKVQQLDKLENVRLQHECIVELVKVGNLMFSHIGGMAYVYGIPMVCLTLYGATTRSLDAVDISAMAGFMMGVVIVMFVITFMGAHMCQATEIHRLYIGYSISPSVKLAFYIE